MDGHIPNFGFSTIGENRKYGRYTDRITPVKFISVSAMSTRVNIQNTFWCVALRIPTQWTEINAGYTVSYSSYSCTSRPTIIRF